MKTGFVLIGALLLFSCGRNKPVAEQEILPVSIPAVFVSSGDTSLQWKNGVYYYRQLPFSGHITEHYSTDMIHFDRSYYKGKEEGWHLGWYPDGVPAEKRYYHSGEKDSIHTGWWPNGQPRFEYHFRKGVYHGYFREWYETGQPSQTIHYNNGLDEQGKGWRQNGKVYMSYITKNNRRYGLINANLCYTLAGEKGEFSRSVSDTLAAR